MLDQDPYQQVECCCCWRFATVRIIYPQVVTGAAACRVRRIRRLNHFTIGDDAKQWLQWLFRGRWVLQNRTLPSCFADYFDLTAHWTVSKDASTCCIILRNSSYIHESLSMPYLNKLMPEDCLSCLSVCMQSCVEQPSSIHLRNLFWWN